MLGFSVCNYQWAGSVYSGTVPEKGGAGSGIKMAYRQHSKLPSLRVTRRSSSGTATCSVVKRGKVEPDSIAEAQTLTVDNVAQPMEVYAVVTCMYINF